MDMGEVAASDSGPVGVHPQRSVLFAQVLGLDGGEEPLVNVEIVSKRRGQRYDALRITSEEIFSKPNKFSIIFGFDSERLKAPLQLEAEVEVRNAGTPIIARIHSGMSESFEGNVSSNLSDVSSTVRKERSMTFWDWPLSDARLEVKADQSWISEFGEIDVLHKGGCLLYTSPSPRDLSTYRMPSSA